MEITLLRILMDVFFIALLLWCAHTDLKTRTVSNQPVVLLLCLGLANTVLMLLTGHIWWQYPAALTFVVPFFIAWLKNFMGGGDVKLIAAIVLYLGLLNSIISFILMLPLLTALLMFAWFKSKTVVCKIPFAPVLAFGSIFVVILGYLYSLELLLLGAVQQAAKIG